MLKKTSVYFTLTSRNFSAPQAAPKTVACVIASNQHKSRYAAVFNVIQIAIVFVIRRERSCAEIYGNLVKFERGKMKFCNAQSRQ